MGSVRCAILYEKVPQEELANVRVEKTVRGGKDYTKLSKSFLGVKALDNVSLEVCKGEENEL